jgi:drug/metabolite transporter (DMT)-like permease
MKYLIAFGTPIGLTMYAYDIFGSGITNEKLSFGMVIILGILLVFAFKVILNVKKKITQPFINSLVSLIVWSTIPLLFSWLLSIIDKHIDRLIFISLWSLLGIAVAMIFNGLYLYEKNKEGITAPSVE